MSSPQRDILDQFLDFIVPGRRKFRLLQDSLAGQREQITQLENQLRQAQNRLHAVQDGLRENVESLHQRITEQSGWFGQIGDRFQQMNSAIEGRFQQLGEDQTALHRRITEQSGWFVQIGDRFQHLTDAIEGRFQQVSGDQKSLHQQVTEQNGWFVQIGDRFQHLTDAIEGRFQQMSGDQVSLHQQVTEQSGWFVQIRDRFQHLTDAIEGRFQQMSGDQVSLHQQVTEQSGWFVQIRDRFQHLTDAIEGRFQQMSGDQVSLHQLVAEQSGWFVQIRDRFQQMTDTIEGRFKQMGEDQVSLHHQVIEQSGWFGQIGDRFKQMTDAIEGRSQQISDAIEGRFQQMTDAGQQDQIRRDQNLTELEYQMKFERHRIDYVLAAQEGILNEVDAFHRARATPEYQAAFTMDNPLVSVCVATAHRPELLISRCLASLQQQTYRNLQIIVVGDHCTDATPSLVAALKDDRITFHNLPERGPYPPPGRDRWCVAGTYPENNALTLCEGQFVTHLDDDDRFEPDRIETMVRAAQASRADICWHPYWYEREDGTWYVLGNGNFETGQVGTDTIFYHRYLARIPSDVFSYRIGEPGDWNRLRKIAMLRPRKHFINRPLAHHYFSSSHPPFVPQEGERYLD